MDWLVGLIARLGTLGPWGAVLFLAAYVVVTIVLAPAFLLTVAAGAVFGVWWGTALVFVGALLGSSAVYALAAPLARSPLLRRFDRDPRFAAVRGAVAGQGVWVVFLLRLSPVVPYVLLNYALALGGVPFRTVLLGSVGMLPTITVYVYYGKVVGDVAKLAAGVAPPRGPGYYVLLSVGVVATIVATALVTRAARRAINSRTP